MRRGGPDTETVRIDFVNVDKGDADNPPSGMDRDGQWWYWNRCNERWERGHWTTIGSSSLMFTPTDQHE